MDEAIKLNNNSSYPFHIICVEDDDNDAFIFHLIISKIFPQAQVSFVENGEEFIHFVLKEKKYKDRPSFKGNHIIFLDINMPRMNGFDVLSKVKSDEKISVTLNPIPFIMMSTSNREQDKAKSLKLGAADYIVKSFCYKEMTSSLYNILNSFIDKGYIKNCEL